jgi:hypothetical protein
LFVVPCLLAACEAKKVFIKNRRPQRTRSLIVKKKLEIIEGASHLFEEKGKINKVTNLAVRRV